MLNHLKIQNHSIIKSAKLIDLGQINVICGKNNSGKSTLLNQINLAKELEIGKKLSREDTQQIINYIRNNVPHPYLSVLMEHFSEEGELVRNIEKYPMFGSESVKLIHEIEFYLKKNMPNYSNGFETFQVKSLINNAIEDVFARFKPNIPKIISLPAKRQLLEKVGISTSELVNSDGKGVINKLFYLQNRIIDEDGIKLYSSIEESFTEISSGHRFKINTEEQNQVRLHFKYKENSNWIEAEKCGLGLRDLLIILYFALEPNSEVVLIEEPENHIHPEMQRKLLRFLKEETDKQYFIATHSNIFLDPTYVDRVFFTKFEDGEVKVEDATNRTEVLNQLGYSIADNLVSDLIILVEGPTDIPFIEEYVKKFGLDAKYGIKTLPLGGDIMDKVDISAFAEKYNVIALIDKDPKSKKSRKKFIENCEKLSIPVTRLSKYALENYFSVSALKEVFKGQIPDEFETIKPNQTLENQIGMNVKKNNRKIAQHMTIGDIEGTDLHDFFVKVKEICEKL